MHRYLKSPTPENYGIFRGTSGQRASRSRFATYSKLRRARPSRSTKSNPNRAILSRFCAQAMSLGRARPGSAPHARDRHEPPGRAQQHRRRRRRSRRLSLRAGSRESREASCFGAFWRHRRISRARRRTRNQNGAGFEAGRRRPASGDESEFVTSRGCGTRFRGCR